MNPRNELSVSMLMMVIKKPMELVMVSAVPFDSACAACATKVENCGESAITAMPHKKNNSKKTGKDAWNSNGDSKQQMNDMVNAVKAVLPLPKYCER